MSDQLDVLKLVAAHLDAAGLPYMVTGSLAASHYAEPRFTRDIDIVVEIVPSDAERLARTLEGDFYVDEDALWHAAARRRMANVIHRELLVKVDFIVRKDTPFRVEEFRRRRPIVVDEATIWFASPEDVILSKLVWMAESGSEVQRRDINAMLALVPDLDRDYIERWVDQLGVQGLWKDLSK